MPGFALALTGLFALAAAAQPAAAKILTVTWQGTLDSGRYCGDISCDDLAGQPFTVTYAIDDSKGTYFSASGVASLLGGAYFTHPAPVSAVATLGGHTFSAAGDYQSGVMRELGEPGGARDAAQFFAQDRTSFTSPDLYTYYEARAGSWWFERDGLPTNGTLFDSLAYDALPLRGPLQTDDRGNEFYFRDYRIENPDTPQAVYSLRYIQGSAASGIFFVPSPVPEPAVWMMMLAGLLIVGGRARSGRHAHSVRRARWPTQAGAFR